MSRARAWLLASRPATLPAAVAPVIVGTACAEYVGQVRWLPALACLAGALLLQISANFANDLFDYRKGADTEERLGPTRAVQAGLLSQKEMALGTVAALLLALLVGLYLASVGGAVFVWVGLLAMASAVLYTAGPLPLGYLGLGELFVFVFFGPVAVVGTAFVQVLFVPRVSIWCGIALGALISSLLVVNNLRDIDTDRAVGKKTLAVRFGRTFSRFEYLLLLLAAAVVPIVLVVMEGAPAWVLLPLALAPLGWSVSRQMFVLVGRELNKTLPATARYLLLFSLLLSLGLVVAGN